MIERLMFGLREHGNGSYSVDVVHEDDGPYVRHSDHLADKAAELEDLAGEFERKGKHLRAERALALAAEFQAKYAVLADQQQHPTEEGGRATLHRLCFRPERSRPIWRNKHTGTEVTVIDLLVNDHGGFQGGCRQFYVQTDESKPAGPPLPPGPLPPGHPLDAFLAHWEPTGKSVPADELPGAPSSTEEGGQGGTELIAAERRRQVEQEGWSPEHDDQHDDGELAQAAAAYALIAGAGPTKQAEEAERLWPFTDGWKPSEDEIRNLAKAGALIAAEIDRLQRLAPSSTEEGRDA